MNESTVVEVIAVKTNRRQQFIDITRDVQRCVTEAGLADGLVCVFVPHTTAGVTLNENADPDVVDDVLDVLSKLVPERAGYRHTEGNSDAHVKSSLMSPSLTVMVENGRLLLGTWQGIYFTEFDGPRNRRCWVKTIGKGQ